MTNAKITSTPLNLSLEEEMFVAMKLCNNVSKRELRNSYKNNLETIKDLSADWVKAINATLHEIDKDLREVGS
jgi:hypothetical protein